MAIPALIKTNQKDWDLMRESANVFEISSAFYTQKIEQLSKQNLQTLEEESAAAKSRARWATPAMIAQYVAGAAAIVFGALAGGYAGNLLIASGTVALASRAAHDTSITEKFFSKNQVAHVEMAALFLQMSLGLASGAFAWHAGALAIQGTAFQSLQKVSSVLNIASGVTNTASHVGMKVYEQKIADLHAKLKEIALHTTLNQQRRTQIATDQTRFLQSVMTETDKLRQIIQTSTIST